MSANSYLYKIFKKKRIGFLSFANPMFDINTLTFYEIETEKITIPEIAG